MSAALPPLPALRAFAAVARLGSVVAAAEELHVTHSAVSHQIRSLENHLGLALVDRSGRRTRLTEAGRIYAYQIRQALDTLALVTEQIRQDRPRRPLRVSVLPSFASHWLLPRLPNWMLNHPDIPLRLEASMAFADFEAEAVDCAIRFGHGEWPELQALRLMGDSLLLVAAPRLFPSGPPPDLQTALAAPVIQASESWETWLAGEPALASLRLPAPVLEVTDSTHLLEAARLGLGIALTRRSIAAEHLARRELVQVTSIERPHGSSYFLVWPHRAHRSPARQRFARWLVEQAGQGGAAFGAAGVQCSLVPAHTRRP